jgi:hypothetical protein
MHVSQTTADPICANPVLRSAERMDGFPIPCNKEEEVKERLLSYRLLFHGSWCAAGSRGAIKDLLPRSQTVPSPRRPRKGAIQNLDYRLHISQVLCAFNLC